MKERIFYDFDKKLMCLNAFNPNMEKQIKETVSYCHKNDISAQCGSLYIKCSDGIEVFNDNRIILSFSNSGVNKKRQYTEIEKLYSDDKYTEDYKKLAITVLWLSRQIHCKSISDIKRDKGCYISHSLSQLGIEVKEYCGCTDLSATKKSNLYDLVCRKNKLNQK